MIDRKPVRLSRHELCLVCALHRQAIEVNLEGRMKCPACAGLVLDTGVMLVLGDMVIAGPNTLSARGRYERR